MRIRLFQLSINSKISVTIITAIIISFVIVFIVLSILEPSTDINLWQTQFFSKIPMFEEHTIIILGSSQSATLNANYIENNLRENQKNYSVYNLSISADRPSKRIQNIDEIINRNPELVIYGIGFIDFENIKKQSFNRPKSVLPDFAQYFSDFFSFEKYPDFSVLQSPKFITLKNMRGMIKPDIINYYYDEKTPFFPYDLKKQSSVMTDEDLKNNLSFMRLSGIKPQEHNPDMIALKKIIQKFEDNDIKVILIQMPFHQYYTKTMPVYYENELEKLSQNLSDKYGIETYSLVHQYDDLEIWNDLLHISIDNQISFFNDDVSEIILNTVN